MNRLESTPISFEEFAKLGFLQNVPDQTDLTEAKFTLYKIGDISIGELVISGTSYYYFNRGFEAFYKEVQDYGCDYSSHYRFLSDKFLSNIALVEYLIKKSDTPPLMEEKLTYFLSSNDFKVVDGKTATISVKGKKTEMKIGKALKRCFPDWIRDDYISKLVEKIKESYRNCDYTLHHGKEREDFSTAYTTPIMSQIEGSKVGKILNNSCMGPQSSYGGVFVDWENHPAEVYASGDFEIYYVISNCGKLGGRVVVTANNTRGPIYASDSTAYAILKEATKDYRYCTDGELLYGLKLLKIEGKAGYIMPYLDFCDLYLDEDSKYFILSEDGDTNYSCYNTCGYAKEMEFCNLCENSVTETIYVDGENVCPSCRDEYYCIVNNNYYHVDSGEITQFNGEWRLVEDLSVDTYGDFFGTEEGTHVYVQEMGEYYPKEECVYSNHTGEYLCETDSVEVILKDGSIDYYHKDEVDNSIYLDTETGNYYEKEAA